MGLKDFLKSPFGTEEHQRIVSYASRQFPKSTPLERAAFERGLKMQEGDIDNIDYCFRKAIGDLQLNFNGYKTLKHFFQLGAEADMKEVLPQRFVD